MKNLIARKGKWFNKTAFDFMWRENAMKSSLNSKLALASTVFFTLLVSTAPTHAGETQASDGASNDQFGISVSVSGSSSLVGSFRSDVSPNNDQGSAYTFRNLDTAYGTVNEEVKLLASNGASSDQFGISVSIDKTMGLVGANLTDDAKTKLTDSGTAYLFRNLDTATGTVFENAILLAKDVATGDRFGTSVSISGTNGLVGSPLNDSKATDQGAAYVFQKLDTAVGTVFENAKLLSTDGEIGDQFGISVSISGKSGLVGAHLHDLKHIDRGAAYLFHNLDSATGTVFQDAKLIASDVADYDEFGISVSIDGPLGLVGSHKHDVSVSDEGAAYLFDKLTDLVGHSPFTEKAKLIAFDGGVSDNFGVSVSMSGKNGLVGALNHDIGANTDQGSAYLFLDLNTAAGVIKQSVKLFATNGANNDQFGASVSLNGDLFAIGAPGRKVGANSQQGTSYIGRVRTFTTADLGSDSTATDGLSFISMFDWIIGDYSSNNSVTLSSGDSGDVSLSGMQVYVGRNSGSNDNTLHVENAATLTSNSINVGASGNSGNQLRANGTINLTSGSVLDIFDGNILSGVGTIQGTGSDVQISGSLRPGSGNFGSGIGTLTRNDGDVTWNGNASSPWVYELGIAKATMLLANTGGTRDLLNITSGDFLKGTGGSFVFDFAGTGWGGWYKLVDWTGTTNFSVTDFSAVNINPAVTSYSFHIDNGPGSTTALYIYMIPEPQVWAVLVALLGTLVVIRQSLRKAARAQSTPTA